MRLSAGWLGSCSSAWLNAELFVYLLCLLPCCQVLRKRRGRTLNRRIILKSYLARAADPSLPPGTPEVRQAMGEWRPCSLMCRSLPWTASVRMPGPASVLVNCNRCS
jgi:hypothetical protein